MSFVEAVRGATSVEEDSALAIDGAVAELCRSLLAENRLTAADVVSAVFTATEDLRARFPATAAREAGWGGVPMLCAQELAVPGAPPRILRLLVHVRLKRRRRLRPVYLGRAAQLRPDLVPPGATK